MADSAVRFHLSLNVANLERSLAFYRALFGVEPAKCRPDYAKFELSDPPVVLSLEPTARPIGGPLNHLGFRFPDAAQLVQAQERLERAGIQTKREEGVECCYSRQTKFWVLDPEQTLWELYILEEDIDHRGAGQSRDVMASSAVIEPVAARAVWQHVMSDPVPHRFPTEDESQDEIALRGTFNLDLTDDVQSKLLREAWRALRPGGRLLLRTLVGEQPVHRPHLPGPASRVEFVPCEAELLRRVEDAGFQMLHQLKFDAAPCFQAGGVPMRELQLEAWKPGESDETITVIYRGPFREVRDDAGNVYPRGQRVCVSITAADMLRASALAECFVMLTGNEAPAHCG